MRKLAKKGNMNERIDVVLRKFRSRMTSYPPGMCPLTLYRSLLQISMNQSCGKCVPCRDGLAEVDYFLKSILNGDATMDTLDKMEKKCRMIASTADCAVGTVGANLILDSLTEFRDEYESHIKRRRCVENEMQTIPCVTLCPAHVDVPGYVACIKEGDYAGAVKVTRDRNPLLPPFIRRRSWLPLFRISSRSSASRLSLMAVVSMPTFSSTVSRIELSSINTESSVSRIFLPVSRSYVSLVCEVTYLYSVPKYIDTRQSITSTK